MAVDDENVILPRIVLKGVPENVSRPQLKAIISKFGKVKNVYNKYGTDATPVKGIAIVALESEEVANELVEKKTLSIEGAEVEIKKAKTGAERQKDEAIVSIPTEALKCHVCKKDRFRSLEAFFNHKQGRRHHALAKLDRSKEHAVLQLLRAESKLAADRAYDLSWVKSKSGSEKAFCTICQCATNYNPKKHNASAEHKMVKNFLQQKCCDVEFTNRMKYSNHLLSLKHLKASYEKEQSSARKGTERLTMKKAIDLYKQCDQDLKELKETYGELDLNEDLPPFENKPIGLNFVVKKINYYCICCDQKFFANMALVEPHCRTYNHYNNMMDYTAEIERENEKRRIEKNKEAENTEVKKREREDGDEENKEQTPKKAKTEEDEKESSVKTKETKKQKETKDDDDDIEMLDDEEEEEAPEHEEEHEEDEDEEGGGGGEVEEVKYDHEEASEHGEEEEEEIQDEEENIQEEEEEMQAQEEEQEEEDHEGNQEEEDNDEVVEVEQEHSEDVDNKGEDSVEEVEEEVEPPKPARGRGRRGRGRGRLMRR